MPNGKKIGFVFIDRFADWEYGLLSASAVEWFGAQALLITPDGQPVTSASGFRLSPHRSGTVADNHDLDAIAVIGSDVWTGDKAPDVSSLVDAVAMRRGVPLIYQGTLMDETWCGRTDFLVRVEEPSALGLGSTEPAKCHPGRCAIG